MLESVLALCIIGLPLFKWRQNELARMIPLVGIAIITSIIILVHTMNTPMQVIYDPITISMICMAVWFGASLLWSDSHLSEWEFQAWVSYLFICYLSRYANPMILLAILMVVGITFAVMSLGEMVRMKIKKQIFSAYWIPRIWFIFGNPVHNMALMTIPLFISIWAGFNISPWWFTASVLMGFNMALSYSYGSYVGVLAGIFTILILTKSYSILILLAITLAILFTCYMIKSFQPSLSRRKTSIMIRLTYLKATLEMLKKTFFYGYGLNMFRKLYPELNPTLFKSEKIKEFIKKSGGVELNTGHRPHNDLADIAIEVGVLGLVLFCSMFYFISWDAIDPIFIGAFVAYATMSLFFFPLREVHTAIGFWVFTGILMGLGDTVEITFNHIATIVAILILLRLLYGVIIKGTGLYFFSLTQKEKPVDAEKNIRMAIACDPYCARYLMFGFLIHAEKEPGIAYEYAQRQLAHFDGGKVKWGVYDQFARAILRFSGINVAEMYIHKALHLNPEYERSKELLGFIHQHKENMNAMMKQQGGLPNGG
jgi:hypothetical protein